MGVMMTELGAGGLATVGRGVGLQTPHRCSPNLLRCPAVPSIWNFFSHKGYGCRKVDAATADERRGNLQRLANVRRHGYWKEKGCFLKQSPFEVSHICSRTFTSCGPQETNVDSLVAGKDNLLIDCGPDQECVLGGIVALGKFDAMHVGHRQLAIQAAKAGSPFLLSFVGMAEVLGWEYRAPIVAHCDRKRVLSTWAPYCDNITPHEYQVEFSTVRHLSPQQFVERLAKDLRVSGVVAGENYRFGYRASGDVLDLVRLCKEYGLEAYIVSPVFDESPLAQNGATTSACKREYVSSTRVRHALSVGDMECVTRLLGRRHRLVLLKNQECIISETMLTFPASCILNQSPKEGVYEQCILLVGDNPVGSCKVLVNSEYIHIKINHEYSPLVSQILDQSQISIEFC